MKTYELTYIISPEITSEEAQAHAKEIELFIQDKEGVILKQTAPFAKTLSYLIKKNASGFVGSLEFQVEPEKLAQLTENLSKDGKIVRHMIIIKKAHKEQKIRRSKKILAPIFEKSEIKAEEKEPSAEKTEKPTEEERKIELKDIEQKLDEILGE